MKRRDFLAGTAAAVGVAACGRVEDSAAPAAKPAETFKRMYIYRQICLMMRYVLGWYLFTEVICPPIFVHSPKIGGSSYRMANSWQLPDSLPSRSIIATLAKTSWKRPKGTCRI